MHPLDNPAWNALTKLQSSVSLGHKLARRYDPAISPIAAVDDSADPACWKALANLVDAGSLVAYAPSQKIHRRLDGPSTGVMRLLK